MTYAYDMTKLVTELHAAAGTAQTILAEHVSEMEPWMLHRVERAREDCDEAARTFETHCEEVAQ